MKNQLYVSVAVTAMIGLGAVAPGAFAQSSDDATDDTVLQQDTIIVTARKQDENLEDVPSSISVLSGADAELLALDGIADYVRQIPNAILVSAGPEYLSDISIRGQGGGRQGFSESATGIYRNGIYIAGGGFGGRSFSRLDFFDLQTVETYRGPQGALYGRNAVGGAVNVISKRPSDDATAEIKVGYESADRYSASGIVNTPLGDNFAARFGAFYIDQQDGFIANQITGGSVDKKEYFGARAQLRADLSAATTVNVTVEYLDSTAPGFAGLGQRLVGRTAAGQTGDAEPDPFTSLDSRAGFVEIDSTAVFAELNSDLDIGDLTVVVNYKQRNGDRTNDDLDSFLGFQGIDLRGITTDLTSAQSEDFERFGGEIRLASKDGGSNTWLIGADYGTHTDDVTTQNGGTSGLGGLAALATRRDAFLEELTSYSAFGLVEFGVADKTKLTLEARLQNDSKDFVFMREQSGAITLSTGDIDDSWTRFLPSATLSRDIGEDQLVYARAASGYRPGGFNTGLDAANANFITYDPETAYSFEAGWKGVLSNGVRFGINGFYVITEEVQAVSTLSSTDSTTALQNVGDTNIFGIEAELGGVARLGKGRLRWSATAATTHGEFTDGSVITTSGGGAVIEIIDLSSVRVNRTRDYVVSLNGFYFAPLTNSLDWFAGGSLQTEGGGYENASGGSTSATGRSLDHYLLFDARAGLSGDNWRLSLFGKNLSDDIYRAQTVAGNAFYNEPKKFGVELKVNFGG